MSSLIEVPEYEAYANVRVDLARTALVSAEAWAGVCPGGAKHSQWLGKVED
jgi:hypothetical protein